jgi:hypothetical protein
MKNIEMVLKMLVFFLPTVEAHDMTGGPTEFIAKVIISFL